MNIDPTITLGAIGNFVALVTLGVTLFALSRKNRRENESDTRDQLSKLELAQSQKISRIEGMVADFVPRREIESKFDHERSNRQGLSESFAHQIKSCAGDIRGLMVDMGTLRQRQESHDATMVEIKALLRDGFREQAAKIERLTESLGARP